jgi:hypothetical protein
VEVKKLLKIQRIDFVMELKNDPPDPPVVYGCWSL